MSEIKSHESVGVPEEDLPMSIQEVKPTKNGRRLERAKPSNAWRKGLFTCVALFGAAFGGGDALAGDTNTEIRNPEHVEQRIDANSRYSDVEKIIDEAIDGKFSEPKNEETPESEANLVKFRIKKTLGNEAKEMFSFGKGGMLVVIEPRSKENKKDSEGIEGYMLSGDAVYNLSSGGFSGGGAMCTSIEFLDKTLPERLHDDILEKGKVMDEEETYEAEKKWNQLNKDAKKNERKDLFSIDIKGKHYYAVHDDSGYKEMSCDDIAKNPGMKYLIDAVADTRKSAMKELEREGEYFEGVKLDGYQKINKLLPEKITDSSGDAIKDILRLKYNRGYAIQRPIGNGEKEYIRLTPGPKSSKHLLEVDK